MSEIGLWNERVAAAFDEAAARYHDDAVVQARIAEQFAVWTKVDLERSGIGGTAIKDALEIGCGTGFLTTTLLEMWPDSRWTISDVSPAMVEICRRRTRAALPRAEFDQVRFRVADGPSISASPRSFDLICSSLAFQWFPDLRSAVCKLVQLLRPGGALVFSTLGANSFCTARRLAPKFFHAYPSPDELRRRLGIPDCELTIDGFQVVETWPGLAQWLKHLRDIGAGTPPPGWRERPSTLLKALRDSRELRGGFPVEYDVLNCSIRVERALLPPLTIGVKRSR